MAAPLTAEDKAALEAALEQIKAAESIVTRAKQAGLDVSEEEATLTALKDQATRLKAAFFPTGRG